MKQSKSLGITGMLRRVVFLVAILFGHPTQLTWLIGAALFLCGVVVHVLTSGYLIRNSQLTQSGPYRFVRHPLYMANFLVDLSLAVISNNVFILLLFMVLFDWSYGARMDKEELDLTGAYPEEYPTYKSTVRRVIPGPWKMPSKGQPFSLRSVFKNTCGVSRFIHFVLYGVALGLWWHVGDFRKLYPPPDLASYILVGTALMLVVTEMAARRVWRRTQRNELTACATGASASGSLESERSSVGGALWRLKGYVLAPPLIVALLCVKWETEKDALVWSVGAALFVVGAFLRVWARQHRRLRGTDGRRKMTATGPYRFVRHPVHIGNILMCIGVTVVSELLWLVPVTLLWCAVVYSLSVRHEERELLMRYGEPYRDYMSRVPRWFPAGTQPGGIEAVGGRFWSSFARELHCVLMLVPFVIKEIIF